MESSGPGGSHCCEIAIVGGGCSGTLTAAQLLRHGFQGGITIIEMRPRLGRGLAYSTPFEQHLLNVPAGNMSAFPDEPAHFLEWLRRRGWPGAAPDAFAPRMLYGDYLADVLQDTVRVSGNVNFRHLRGEVVDATTNANQAILRLSDESTVTAGKVVFALGNPASAPLNNATTRLMGDRWHDSPWIGGALRVRFPGERILLVGTGLTAIDAVLAFHSQCVLSKTYLLSRRGILPQVHSLGRAAAPPPVFENPNSIRLMFRQLRAQIALLREQDQCWRTAIDALRPVSNDLWRGLRLADQRRFLRHLRRYWEVHRHRMAPQVRRRLDELIAEHRVEVISGRIHKADRRGGTIDLTIAQRGFGERHLQVDRAINCTGIHEDYRGRPRRLIGALIDRGLAAPNDLGSGFRTGEYGELIDSQGSRSAVLFTLGPPRRGDLFETTAVPEIRRQAEALARHLISL